MSRLPVVIATSLLFLARSAIAQRLPTGVTQGAAQGTGIGDVPVTSGDDTQKKQREALHQQREAEIKRDTEKMLELTRN